MDRLILRCFVRTHAGHKNAIFADNASGEHAPGMTAHPHEPLNHDGFLASKSEYELIETLEEYLVFESRKRWAQSNRR